MSAGQNVSTCALPPALFSWRLMVEDSISVWDGLHFHKMFTKSFSTLLQDALRSFHSLDDFLQGSPNLLMFYFFQKKRAFLDQDNMRKWNRARLQDYVLLPAAINYISRRDCFFVSHYWRSKDHPDPDGEYLRKFQHILMQPEFSYIWVDWTCTPQAPRSFEEETYFIRSLDTMSALIRNCGFVWFYPPFEARLWILYEVAEYTLTSIGGFMVTEDVEMFKSHVDEMVRVGVRPVLSRYNYTCTNDHDKIFITSWLELLVLLKQLRFGIGELRLLMDSITWHVGVKRHFEHLSCGEVELRRFDGKLLINGEQWSFTPFPPCTWFDRPGSAPALP